jgi:hypothetical protein
MNKTLWAAALLSLGAWSAPVMAQQSNIDNPCGPGEVRNASGNCVATGDASQNTLGTGVTGGGGSGSGGGTGEDTVGGAAATGTGTGAASGSGSGTTMVPGSGNTDLNPGVTGGGGSGSGGGTGEDTVGGSRTNN